MNLNFSVSLVLNFKKPKAVKLSTLRSWFTYERSFPGLYYKNFIFFVWIYYSRRYTYWTKVFERSSKMAVNGGCRSNQNICFVTMAWSHAAIITWNFLAGQEQLFLKYPKLSQNVTLSKNFIITRKLNVFSILMTEIYWVILPNMVHFILLPFWYPL